MRRIIFTLSLCLLLPVLTVSAQQKPVTKANYELAERFAPSKVNRCIHSTLSGAEWFKNSDRFWYMWKDSNGTHYYVVDPVSKTKKEIFDMDKLASELTLIVKDPYDWQHIPIDNLKLKDDNTFTFSITSSQDAPADTLKKTPAGKKVYRFEYTLSDGKLKDVTENEEKKDYPSWANISPDSSSVVYAKGYNLFYTDMENIHKWMMDEKDSTFVEYQLTFDGTKDTPYGGDDYKGVSDRDTTERNFVLAFWSPDSRYFYMEKYDMSGIGEMWVINSTSEPRPTLETYKYQMPGEPGPIRYNMLFDMSDKSCKYLDFKAFKDQTVALNMREERVDDIQKDYVALEWLGDNNNFYFSRHSRDLHRIDICRYNIAEDSVYVLIEERFNKYIDVFDFKVLRNGDIVMASERDGWSQLYLHSKDGKLKNRITQGPFHVSEIKSVDEKNGYVYFTATGYNRNEHPNYIHFFRAALNGSGVTMLNEDDKTHMVSLSLDNKFFVDYASRVDCAPSSALYSANGKKLLDLEEVDMTPLFDMGYKFPEVFSVKAADGVTDLWGVMYKPFDFDSTRSYPIIEYVYPGPQVEATNYLWSGRMNRVDRLAQLGFIVITVGQRGGHPDRSKWYHTFGYGNMRDYPLADHKWAIQQLAARHSFIDVNRVGIHGHSGGGFMSTAAILTYPDFYKVAVSCAGNHDNRIYNRWWSETHHGVKEVVTDGDTTFSYSIGFNQELVKNLKGRLLLVHGDMDDNVHPANSTRVIDALIRANKRFDMLYLPGQRHGFGDMDEYFFWKMADYFSRYLIGDYENCVDIRQMNNN